MHREIEAVERGWTIVAVDGDGAVPDLPRDLGQRARPLFSARWRAAVGGIEASRGGDHELSIRVGTVG